MALAALQKHRTMWRRITRFPSPWRWVPLQSYFLFLVPRMWSGRHTIRTTCVTHSSHWLQLCCSCSHNTWRCVYLSPAECHISPFHYCYISDGALSLIIVSLEMLSRITMQSSVRVHHLPLNLLLHYHILQVWNILSHPRTPVLCPQSSKSWVDPSLACDGSSSQSVSA